MPGELQLFSAGPVSDAVSGSWRQKAFTTALAAMLTLAFLLGRRSVGLCSCCFRRQPRSDVRNVRNVKTQSQVTYTEVRGTKIKPIEHPRFQPLREDEQGAWVE